MSRPGDSFAIIVMFVALILYGHYWVLGLAIGVGFLINVADSKGVFNRKPITKKE